MFNINFIIREIVQRVPKVIIDVADEHNWELYAVGGCVRNPLLGRPVVDLDIAVVGDAAQLAELVAKRMRVGTPSIYVRFQTALVKTFRGNIEFAATRRESYRSDSRKPAEVTLATIEEDLRRRDFTVNAFAVGITGPRQGQLLDLFDGLEDLKNRILRTPLDPDATFSDDPLRILRAVRFAAELDFTIFDSTLSGIKRNIDRLDIVAAERIGDEFQKMLSGADPTHAMILLIETGLMQRIIPEVTAMSGVEQVGRHQHKDVLIHSLRVMQNLAVKSNDSILRLAGLLHDIGKPLTKRFDKESGWTFHGHEAVGANMAYRIGRRLRLGHNDLEKLTHLIRLHMRPVNLTDEGVTDSAIRRLMVEAGDYLDEQMALCRADITTANPKLVDRYLQNFDLMVERMADVQARDKMRAFQSPVRGDEIIALCSIEPGPLVGALKGRIEDAILDGVIPNEYAAAKDYLMKIKDNALTIDKESLIAERKVRAQARSSVTHNFKFPDNGN
ncbi:MAG: HD domain-containing protein [Calditrichaeota bacterium]|nr:HD domain-containing protein [Calditrichota bacterium]